MELRINFTVMNKTLLALASLMTGLSLSAQEIQSEKIWDNGKYCAFPSIEKFDGRYYCCFREGESHIFDSKGLAEGKIRVIASVDGTDWQSVALIERSGIDLRDPKLSVTPQGKLMVSFGGSVYKDKQIVERIPQVSLSDDGKTFCEPIPARVEKKAKTWSDWLWRVSWYRKNGYVVNYSLDGEDALVSLFKTRNGIDYKLIKAFDIPDFPNEATVRIMPDGEMLMMLRREKGSKMGLWGRSKPPYRDWTFTDMNLRLGGPDFIAIDDSLLVAGTRFYQKEPKTLIMTGGRDGKFSPRFILPSGEDNSYPGFIIVDNELWICYYSRHETPNACIYLAKVPLVAL